MDACIKMTYRSSESLSSRLRDLLALTSGSPWGCVPSFGNFMGLHDRDLYSPINGITVGIRGRIIAVLGGLIFYTL